MRFFNHSRSQVVITNKQHYLVRVTLNSKADKPVALISGSNWNLESVLVFVEGGKPENPEKNPRSRDENQQQTQPTCDAGSGNRTRATAVGGKRSHHCAIPTLRFCYFDCCIPKSSSNVSFLLLFVFLLYVICIPVTGISIVI